MSDNNDNEFTKQELSRSVSVLGCQCRLLEAMLKRRVPLNLDDISSPKELENELGDRKPWRGSVISGLKKEGLIEVADWTYCRRRLAHSTIRMLWKLAADERTVRGAIELRKNLLQAIQAKRYEKPASGCRRKRANNGRASA